MNELPKNVLIAQLETAVLEALALADLQYVSVPPEGRAEHTHQYLLDCVNTALAGDPPMARALMQIIAWLHREAMPLPRELRYYIGEAFARIVADGRSADEAFGLRPRHNDDANLRGRE